MLDVTQIQNSTADGEKEDSGIGEALLHLDSRRRAGSQAYSGIQRLRLNHSHTEIGQKRYKDK